EIKLLYKVPHDTTQKQFLNSVPFVYTDFNSLDKRFRFSTAVIMFGSMLRSSAIAKNMRWDDLILLATQAADDNDPLEKEFVSLVTQAKTLYYRQKKKRKEYLTSNF